VLGRASHIHTDSEFTLHADREEQQLARHRSGGRVEDVQPREQLLGMDGMGSSRGIGTVGE
jgi:hypothetical protein